MANWDLSLIAGLLGLAAIVYLIERETNRSNALLKTILAQTERSNALLADIHKLAETKLGLIADRQSRISPDFRKRIEGKSESRDARNDRGPEKKPPPPMQRSFV